MVLVSCGACGAKNTNDTPASEASSLSKERCIWEDVNGPPCRDFSSLGEEHMFWLDWIAHHSHPWGMESFYWGNNEDLWKSADLQIAAIAKASEVFLLAIDTSQYHQRLDIVCVAKDKKGWQGIRWEKKNDILDQSVFEATAVDEKVLKTLSSRKVYVDAYAPLVFDACRVYVFLRYKGKCSRFAIHHPEGAKDNSVASALKTLLQSIGL